MVTPPPAIGDFTAVVAVAVAAVEAGVPPKGLPEEAPPQATKLVARVALIPSASNWRFANLNVIGIVPSRVLSACQTLRKAHFADTYACRMLSLANPADERHAVSPRNYPRNSRQFC